MLLCIKAVFGLPFLFFPFPFFSLPLFFLRGCLYLLSFILSPLIVCDHSGTEVKYAAAGSQEQKRTHSCASVAQQTVHWMGQQQIEALLISNK